MNLDFNNPFLLPNEHYQRDINPVKHYVEQAAKYLSISKGINIEDCKVQIINKLGPKYSALLRNGGFQPNSQESFPKLKDPVVTYLYRDADIGDRYIEQIPLSRYINDIIKEDEIMAPTMTTYMSSKKRQSILALDIDDKVRLRNIAKRAMFAAEARNDKTTQFFENITQKGTKLQNNSISGAHATPSNPLFNPSSHSTLTSNCRMTSGYGNANNEKLLTGNRHYFNFNIILNNIVSIISNSDYTKIKAVVEKYQLTTPTVDDVMRCIKYSSHLYGLNNCKHIFRIKQFVEKLTDLERIAFVYTGDLYHIKKHNKDFMRAFITRLITKVEGKVFDDGVAVVKGLHEDHVTVSHQICSIEMMGKGKDYAAIAGSKELNTLAATSINVSQTIHDYADFLEAFLVTTNLPAATPYFPDSIRRAAVISDTDSTIFTVKDWQVWYHGELAFHPEAIAVGAIMVFLASQSIINVLAIMSKNAGVENKRLRQIAMKNEFYYPVIVPTKVAKHYFGVISCQEGNVYTEDKYKFDIKGVHLKSSNAPKHINDAAEELMKNILLMVRKGEQIKIEDKLKFVADIERDIYYGIAKADTKYFRLGEIKTSESYTRPPMESNYMHYILWKECFSDKYGDFGVPPYQVLRVKTTLDSVTNTKYWLDKMEDRILSKRISDWLFKNNRDSIPTMQIPIQAASGKGIPKEIFDAIDTREMVVNLSKVFYLILETLGFHFLNERKTTLVSDYY